MNKRKDWYPEFKWMWGDLYRTYISTFTGINRPKWFVSMLLIICNFIENLNTISKWIFHFIAYKTEVYGIICHFYLNAKKILSTDFYLKHSSIYVNTAIEEKHFRYTVTLWCSLCHCAFFTPNVIYYFCRSNR